MTDTAGYEEIKARHTTGNGKGDNRSPPPSRALSWAQLKNAPDPAYVVKGLIDRGTLIEIYGPHSSGKSFFASDMGMHVALGWQWRGRRVKKGGVMYVSAEGNAKRRIAAFEQHYKIDLDEVPFFVVIAPTNMLTPEGIAQVIADAGPVPDLSMIIIDTAARVMPGGKEDTEDMGAFVAACDEIRDRTGAAVVVVHHTGKNVSNGSRGSNTLPAAADSMIEISKDDKTKLHIAEHVKARDGETGAKFGFRLLIVHLGRDDDGDPITSCIVEVIEDVGTGGTGDLTRDERAYLGDITTFFARSEVKIETVIPELGSVAVRAVPRNAIRDWLKHRGRFRVADDGALTATDRSDLRRILNSLRDKGKLGMTQQYIWLIP